MKIGLKKKPLGIAIEAIAILALVVTIGLIATSWHGLPDIIPHHFDLAGNPDAWGRKQMIFLLPAISLGLYLVLTALVRYPQRFNFPWEITEQNAQRQYRIALSLLAILKAEVMLIFAYITWGTIRAARHEPSGLGGAFLCTVVTTALGTILIHLAIAYRAR